MLGRQAGLSLHACAAAAHDFFDLRERGHRRVARRRHGQRTMRCAAFDCPLWALMGQKTVNEAGGKGVPAAHAVETSSETESPEARTLLLSEAMSEASING